MAIARLGSIVGGISGTLSGTCFANTSAGLVLKQALRRVDHATEAQLEKRADFMGVKRKWQELTDEQRDAWHTNAKAYTFKNRLGKPTYFSGFQWFVKLNSMYTPVSAYEYDDPPLFIATAPITDFGILAKDDGIVQVSAYESYQPTATMVLIYGSQPWSSKPRKAWAYWRYLASGSTTWPWIDISVRWAEAFGDLIEGQRIAIKLINWNPGTLPSPPFIKSHTVTAAP